MYKKQHFVPEVYTKAWKTEVTNKKEPNKAFAGVYIFKNADIIGDGANIGSILWKPQLYTIGYDYLFVGKSCSKILSWFVNQIYETMQSNKPNPVYGKFGYSIIKTKESIRKHILDIEEWDFFYYNGNCARKESILRVIRGLNCYILENAFDDVFEKHWEKYYQQFISEVREGRPVANEQDERQITSNSATNMLKAFLIMLCRNPIFDAMGIYTNIKNRILIPNIENERAVDVLMKGGWYTDLYSMLFKNTKSFYHSIIKQAIEGCKMVLFETYKNAGKFITSDNPAFQYKSPVIDKENTSGFVFPITPNHLLFICKGIPNSIDVVCYRFANKDTIKHFNRIIKDNCVDILISCENTIE